MLVERMVGREASNMRRLGALGALFYGVAALLALALVSLQPAADNVVAALVCAGLAAAGVAIALGN